ncbi:MAG: phosphate acyltransferase PlsX [Oscillospiraceae bacterium]|nr:phosphate acyltransferase PlsX [Oscillospiraceae bacterium]
MKIIIDAMGGDNAPQEIVRGAVDAQSEFGVDIILVGREDEVKKCLADCGAEDNLHITVADAPDVIEMCDDPTSVVTTKKHCSMAVALRLLRDGAGDACISAGNTGALLSGATLIVKRIRGIRRAALAPALPNGGSGALLIDCGANAECTAELLLQFAYMGSFYSQSVLGCESPRVGLLNIGAENNKGTALSREVHALLTEAGASGRINFIGNIEPTAIMENGADVVVADGFSGNIFLKTLEGAAAFVMRSVKGVFYSGVKGKLAGALIASELKGLKTQLSVSEYGGTALLGISKPVIKAHGGSNARAIRSAVKQAIAFVQAGVTDEITRNIEFMKVKDEKNV